MTDTTLRVANENVCIQKNGYSVETGENIGYEKGAKMVKNYYDKNHNTESHFIGKNVIEAILAQPGAVGINVLYGVNESGSNTPILVGVNENGNYILNFTIVDGNGQLSKQKGMITMGGVRSPGSKSCGWFE